MSYCRFIDKLRGPRLFGLAIFDWTLSFSIAWIIGHYIIKLVSIKQWVIFLILWVLFGIIVHVAQGVPTMSSYYLGLSAKPTIKKC
jgi:uncharacterized membrane protein YcaP (DUF421 family)